MRPSEVPEMRSATRALAVLSLVIFVTSAADAAARNGADPPDTLRLNQIQVIGTHNSYQQPIDPRVMDLMLPRLVAKFQQIHDGQTPVERARFLEEHPGGLRSAEIVRDALNYFHMPIEAQLDAGIRSLEFDLHPDRKGGRFADPIPHRELAAAGVQDLAPFNVDEMRSPGTKVLHIPDIDFRSQCPRFRQCLQILRQWSDRRRDHSPIFVLLEPKLVGLDVADGAAAGKTGFDRDAFETVDAEILEVIGRDRILVPDDVRGTHQSLEASVLAGAWPTVGQMRGKFLFAMLVPAMNFDAFAPYIAGRPSLEGRVAFVQGVPGMPHAAFVLVDNALVRPGQITDLVKLGYLVRSRADINTLEARQNDPGRRDATIGSGAQIVSTDFPFAPNIYGNDYHVRPFPGGFRRNPVNGYLLEEMK